MDAQLHAWVLLQNYRPTLAVEVKRITAEDLYHTFVRLRDVQKAKAFRRTLGNTVTSQSAAGRLIGDLSNDGIAYRAISDLSYTLPLLFAKLTPGGFKTNFPLKGLSGVCLIDIVNQY